MHNARNAAGALIVTIACSPAPTRRDAAQARSAASAVWRGGFEFRGVVDGITFVDDYAHLPTEVEAATRGGVRRRVGRGSICVFQPHRYSRTAALWQDFARLLRSARTPSS